MSTCSTDEHLDKKAIKIDICLTSLLNDYVGKKLRVNVLHAQTQKQPKRYLSYLPENYMDIPACLTMLFRAH